MAPTEWLELGVEQYLREMDDTEFDALTAKVRPPKERRYPANRARKPRNTNASGEAAHG